MAFVLFKAISQLDRENGEGSLTPGIRKHHPQSLGDLVINILFMECV
jgi:hypothetical protein